VARALWVPDKLREYGVNVVAVAGWQTRGSETFTPKVVIAHHTAGPNTGDAPSLNLCINGRHDLPGPLCQIVLGRTGTAYIIASGRANHAGAGGWNAVTGNTNSFGVEAENTGRGDEPWPTAQLEAYYRVCAALLDGIGRDQLWVCGHKEWAPRRKIDPWGLDMNVFRAEVGKRLGHSTPAPTPPPTQPTPTGGRVKVDVNLPLLREGTNGKHVESLQHLLNVKAGQGLSVDGSFGPSTKRAVTNVQSFFGLGADGVVGPNTWKLLLELPF
jgi:hypothetical protein